MPRLEHDAYMTPPHYVSALLNEVNIHGHVFEPCVGDGAIADELRKMASVRRVYTNDIDKKRKADTHYDARHTMPVPKFDWAVTNPPFSDMFDIVVHMLDTVPNVAVLARLSFLEPTEERADLLENNPPTQIIVLPRYSFRVNDAGKKQTDNVTCAWLVWEAHGAPRRTSFYGRGKAQHVALIRSLT